MAAAKEKAIEAAAEAKKNLPPPLQVIKEEKESESEISERENMEEGPLNEANSEDILKPGAAAILKLTL